ncbi:hypothetical protein ACH518_11915 [Methylomonas sp. HW2-6]|uniref:hypothetical protein n=1 Tax=Methylomonas TaxID=416 RepID=UPI00112E4D70|nr:hypothetical protein [Methylomonas koyamae]TPQ26911.1 hypothetical protein C2U68_09485 [Methylomonas koyamae]
MIVKVRESLGILDKLDCEHDSLFFQEKGKGVKLSPSGNGSAMKIRVDDQTKNNGSSGLISIGARCDCLYFYEQSGKRYAFLVELKGNNYPTALKQLETTIEHWVYKVLCQAGNPSRKCAVAIVSEKANINRPRVEEWEDKFNHRLIPIRLPEDQTYDLAQLTKRKLR